MKNITYLILFTFFSSATCSNEKKTAEQITLNKINDCSTKFALALIPKRFGIEKGSNIETEILEKNNNKFFVDGNGTIKSKIKINFGKNNLIEGDFNIDSFGDCKYAESLKKTKNKDALASLGVNIVLGFKLETNLVCTVTDWKPINWDKILKPSQTEETYLPLPKINKLSNLIKYREEKFDALGNNERRVIEDYYTRDMSLAGLKKVGNEVINLDEKIIIIYGIILSKFSAKELRGFELYRAYKSPGFFNVKEEKAYHKFMNEKFDKSNQIKLGSNYEVLACELLIQISPKLYWAKRPRTRRTF